MIGENNNIQDVMLYWTTKIPFKNVKTEEIRYFSRFTLYVSLNTYVREDWQEIEETETIKLLYGDSK